MHLGYICRSYTLELIFFSSFDSLFSLHLNVKSRTTIYSNVRAYFYTHTQTNTSVRHAFTHTLIKFLAGWGCVKESSLWSRQKHQSRKTNWTQKLNIVVVSSFFGWLASWLALTCTLKWLYFVIHLLFSFFERVDSMFTSSMREKMTDEKICYTENVSNKWKSSPLISNEAYLLPQWHFYVSQQRAFSLTRHLFSAKLYSKTICIGNYSKNVFIMHSCISRSQKINGKMFQLCPTIGWCSC